MKETLPWLCLKSVSKMDFREARASSVGPGADGLDLLSNLAVEAFVINRESPCFIGFNKTIVKGNNPTNSHPNIENTSERQTRSKAFSPLCATGPQRPRVCSSRKTLLSIVFKLIISGQEIEKAQRHKLEPMISQGRDFKDRTKQLQNAA